MQTIPYATHQTILKQKQQMSLQSSSSSHPPKLLQIFLRLDDGNGYQLLLQPDLTIDELTARIRRCPLLLPTSFRLVYMGQPLSDQASNLKELKLHQRSIIHIENISPSSPKCLKIDVCVYFQEEVTVISCMTTDTVYELKQKLKKVINFLPKNQILVFRGTILSNQSNLEQYHIKANSLLCLTIENQKKQSELSPIPSINLQKEGTNSVILKQRKNSKEMFRSEVFPQRPAFQIEIREKDNFDDSLFKREFSFGGLYPKLSDLVLEKQSVDSSDKKSSELYIESEDSEYPIKKLDRSLFKKIAIR